MKPILEDHDLGFAHDLGVMERQVMERRRALIMLGSAGTAGLLAACGGGGSPASTGASTAGSTSSTSGGSTSSSSGGSTSTSSGGTSATCVAVPRETGGPYPADGTNNANGLTSNALVQNGIVRSDIRRSFLGNSTALAAGVQTTVVLNIVNVNASCAALANYAVYLWHADAQGRYSLYDLPNESYLRGLQATNAQGQVTFTTVFPGCYAGRYPHMHFEVFSTLAGATSGNFAVLTSQLAMPAAACNSVYADSATYPQSASRFAQISTSNDNVFGDNSSAQIAAMTPAATGSVAAGFTLTATIGIAL